MKRITLLTLLVCATTAYIQSPLLAQTDTSADHNIRGTYGKVFEELSPSDQQVLEQRTMELVLVYQNYLEKLAQKTISRAEKEYYYKEALNLFVGQGKSYLDSDGNLVRAVVTEVSSVMRGTVTPVETAIFLRHMMNYRYERVDLDSATVVCVDQFVKISDTEYRATAHIAQRFTGWSDGRIVWSDIIWKDTEIIIRLETPITSPIWTLYLGDTKVITREKMR